MIIIFHKTNDWVGSVSCHWFKKLYNDYTNSTIIIVHYLFWVYVY